MIYCVLISAFCVQEYQLKEQCRSCHFQNGHLASQCEMCGKPLSKSAGSNSSSAISGNGARGSVASAYRR